MRIAHVDLGESWRGGQQQMLLLARGLRTRGHEQSFVVGAEVVSERLRAEGFAVYGAGVEGRRQAARADVVHAHDGRAHTWGMRHRRVARPPLLGAARPLPPRLEQRQGGGGLGTPAGAQVVSKLPRLVLSRRVAFPIRGWGSRWKYRHTGMVLAVSAFVRRQVLEAGVRPERVRVVYDGVDLAALEGARGERARLRARLGMGDDACVLVCAGAMSAEKGVEDALAALRQLPERFQLVLTGVGGGREGRIHRVGEDGEEMSAWVAAGDIFVMPSRQEGLGSAALVAMGLGCAVVASTAGGIPEVIEDGVTGLLVAPGDIGALAAACQQMGRDGKLRARLAVAARNEVERKFTMEQMVEATVAGYEEVLGGETP